MRAFKATCAFCNWEETIPAPNLFVARTIAVKQHSEQENTKVRLLCIPDIKVGEVEHNTKKGEEK